MKTARQDRNNEQIAASVVAQAATAAAKTVTETATATAALLGNDIGYMKRDISQLQEDMKLILENHLPHIREDISSLSTKITLFTAINIGGIMLGIIATRIIK